jgi:carbon-monoxide dehydrogenase medium subunit
LAALPRFEYVKPDNLRDAIHLLADRDREPKVLAGGTDLLVRMKKGMENSRVLVDIKTVPQLKNISLHSNDDLRIGAAVTLTELDRWIGDRRDWPGLSMAIRCIGSEQVRNRGTIVGNICRASPAGDMAPVLIALDAVVEIDGPKGERSVLLENFMTGPGETLLSHGEIVTSIRIPKPPPHTSNVYLKHGIRRAMEIAMVGVAVRMTLDRKKEKIECARIVLGAVAATPIRVPEGENILLRDGLSRSALSEIANVAAETAAPITDIRGTESYRTEIVKVYVRRAIEQAWALAKGGEAL